MENQRSISSDLIRGHIDTIILHSLLHDDKFAQQISDYIQQKSNDEYNINQATLYSSLKRLETLKLVETYWHDVGDGRRKFFKITELGKNTVEKNLSSWSYSKTIIEKLMDVSPTVPPFVADKPTTDFEITKDQEKSESAEIKPENPTVTEDEKTEDVIKTEKTAETQKVVNVSDFDEYSEEKEKNFRSVLNGLMSLSVSHENDESNVEKLTPFTTSDEKNSEFKITTSDTDAKQKNANQSAAKFNKTLSETDYNVNKAGNGKTDYGDLSQKAAKEGYVLRISSKNSAIPKGNLLKAKLNFYSTLLTFIVCIVESVALFLIFGFGAFINTPVLVLASLPIIPLLIFGFLFIKSPKKSVKKRILPDSILTAAIVAFNLILVVFVVTFISNLDLSNKIILLSAIVYPIIYCVDLVLFFLFRFLCRGQKKFNSK